MPRRGRSWREGLNIVCLSALAGVAGPVLFGLVTGLAQALQPGYNPVRETVSMLALGQYGWVVTAGLIVLALLLLVFAARLYSTNSGGVAARIGAGCFLLITAGLLLVAVFPTGEPGTPATIHSEVHFAAASGISILFAMASLAFAVEFRANDAWRRYFVYSLITGLVAIALIVVRAIAPEDWYWKGLHERIFLAEAFAWIAVISIRLLRTCVGQRHADYRQGGRPGCGGVGVGG